jgi:hypothetical protein
VLSGHSRHVSAGAEASSAALVVRLDAFNSPRSPE